METIIIVSVLSTLGVVGLILSILAAFRKLKIKVDVNEFNELQNFISTSMDSVYQRIDEVQKLLADEDEDIRRAVDSRCDKLHSLIDPSLISQHTQLSKKRILKS
jgi:hypothetical protein